MSRPKNLDEQDLDLIRLTEIDHLLDDFENQVVETVKLEPEIVSITSALPAKVYKTNDKISNSLPNLMGQGPQDLRIEGRDSPVSFNQIHVSARAQARPFFDLTISLPFSFFMRIISI